METGAKTLKIMRLVNWYNNWLFSRIKENLKGEILEVGAGIGNFTTLLKTCGRVTAIDIEKDYITKLKKIKEIKVGFGDIEKGNYFFKNKRFDRIVCLNVLEHIKADEVALKNMYDLLKKGGKLILLVPAHQWAYGSLDEELGHFRRYDKALAQERMRKAGFKVKLIRYINWIGIFGWFINAKITRRKILSKSQLAFFDKIARLLLKVEDAADLPFGLSVLVIGEK